MTFKIDREILKIADYIEKLAFEMKAPNIYTPRFVSLVNEIRTAIHIRLAQQEQEPVAWLSTDGIGERYLWFSKPLDNDKAQPLYTTLPEQGQLEWQGLTDEESNRLVIEHLGPHALTGGKISVYDAFLLAIRATEAKLKEKNT